MLTDAAPPAGVIDHHTVDWRRVRRAAYLLHQRFTYEYPGAVADLRQRLIVLPSEWHGGQRLLAHDLAVTTPRHARRDEFDPFGNRVVWLTVPRVERRIAFIARIELERHAGERPPTLPAALAPRYLAPTSLTTVDATLDSTAAEVRRSLRADSQLEFVARLIGWVHGRIRYTKGVTGVRTTAAEALALGGGVCQDYAHVALALLRRCGIAARYVSGHLLGEGGTHAWIEALLPAADRSPKVLVAHAFDPTHGCAAGLNYITVATGRDYLDVAPTCGSYTAPYQGSLHASKRALVTAIEYDPAPDRGEQAVADEGSR